jgi:hypothetical protein
MGAGELDIRAVRPVTSPSHALADATVIRGFVLLADGAPALNPVRRDTLLAAGSGEIKNGKVSIGRGAPMSVH